ncbi:MAG: hypothetical protein Q9209_005874 [Squamulea sp. 1 TL-2023]
MVAFVLIDKKHPPHHINSTGNINFLDVDCFHLDPTTSRISLQTCQSLFAWMMSEGDAYKKHTFWNGWVFKRPGNDPCVITIASPVKADRLVDMSFAQLVLSAHKVLEQCSTGGADTFEGFWRVVVTKGIVKKEYKEQLM